MKLLKTENITMQFGGLTAVKDFNMELNQGEIVALIGPNGAGKTTAFNVITGVYRPTAGRVLFNQRVKTGRKTEDKAKDIMGNVQDCDRSCGQRAMVEHRQVDTMINEKDCNRSYEQDRKTEHRIMDITGMRPDRITKLGIARTFQNIRLFKDLSVLDNVLIANHLHVKSNFLEATFRLPRYWKESRQMMERSMDLLERVGLIDLRNEKAHSLPYGQQRRLEIARALATDPEVLLLDEPAAGMNPKETDDLTLFIKRIRDEFELSILMIEHHMEVVMGISERIYVLDYGITIAQGNPHQIQNNPRVIEAYLGVNEDA